MENITNTLPLFLLAASFAGFALGLVYFAMLKRTVALYGAGGGWFGPLALTLGRIVTCALLLAGMAKFGAGALLSASLGFFLAHPVSLYLHYRRG